MGDGGNSSAVTCAAARSAKEQGGIGHPQALSEVEGWSFVSGLWVVAQGFQPFDVAQGFQGWGCGEWPSRL